MTKLYEKVLELSAIWTADRMTWISAGSGRFYTSAGKHNGILKVVPHDNSLRLFHNGEWKWEYMPDSRLVELLSLVAHFSDSYAELHPETEEEAYDKFVDSL